MTEQLPSEGRGRNQGFTAADRIAELNEIDRSVASLLQSAGSAISILANDSVSSSASSLSDQQAAFTTQASTYFATLSNIDVRLRRQIYALEEAGLVSVGDDRDSKRGRTLGADDMSRVAGNGALDNSWLNARASDHVERGMMKEILTSGRQVIGRLGAEKKASITQTEATYGTVAALDEKMDVDTSKT